MGRTRPDQAGCVPGLGQVRRMELSAAGRALIKQSEGFRARVYKDAAGLATIGWGHRCLHPDSFPDGVSEELAEHILACDIDDAEAAVVHDVKVQLTQGQFDALVDFTFNLGVGTLSKSTLIQLLNAGNYDGAANELLKWDHAGGKELAALKTRREAEYQLWHDNKETE